MGGIRDTFERVSPWCSGIRKNSGLLLSEFLRIPLHLRETRLNQSEIKQRPRSWASLLSVLLGTGWAHDHFLDILPAFPTWIIRVVLLTFSHIIGAKERVGPATIRILLAPHFQDKALARSPGRHDALTHLAAIHGDEPMNEPSGWLMSRKGSAPHQGLTGVAPPGIKATKAARSTCRGSSNCQSTGWQIPRGSI
jgi:hypothetical protein